MRTTVVVQDIKEPKSFGDKGGQVVSFKAISDGKELTYQTFNKDLFPALVKGRGIEVEYNEKTREWEGNTYTDRNVFQIYVNGEPVVKKEFKGGFSRPDNTQSIEAQCAFKGIIELIISGELDIKDPLSQSALNWAKQRMGIKPETKPEPKHETAKVKPGDDIFPPEPAAPEAKSKPLRDPATIKTTAQLQKALFEDFKLQPKDQLAELNLKAWSDMTITPAEAYIQVAAARQ